uniref:Tpd52 like 2a n=1 Tax=Hippocampus comes TaxID=109280 RepID=A0A3Q2XQ83_HIPCM
MVLNRQYIEMFFNYYNPLVERMEEEIQTLRQVLLTKEKSAADIRRQLGMGPLSSIKENLSKGWQEVQTSSPYLTASAVLDDINNSNVCVRTKEGLAHASHVTSSALTNVGVVITRRLAELRYTPMDLFTMVGNSRCQEMSGHSSTFRSFEEMVGSVKVSGLRAVM